MLRIGIDAHVLTGKSQGGRTWLVNIIGRAAARHRDATYVVYSGDPEACARLVSGDNIEHRRLPRVPATYEGEKVFGDGQLRYWSMCTVSMQPYGVTDTVGCVNDSTLATDADGWYTLAISTPEDRPANARLGCGVTWLPFGARPTAALVMRNQLADPQFAHAVQQVTKPGTERAVMGDYLPRGHYSSAKAFERRGC